MLEIVPCDIGEANEFILQHHRHHGKVAGGKFAVACSESERVCGVAIVGRPVSRMLDNGYTLEVTRLATDGTQNACSMLYAAAWRSARSLGYRKLITYILRTETGVSLCASGWRRVGECEGGSWHRESRPRVDKHPTQSKMRYEMAAV